MKIAWPDYLNNITIKWGENIDNESYKKNPPHQNDYAYFYKIIGKHGSSYKLFYIGQTYRQDVAKRLNQLDHRKRFRDLKKKYPHHKIFVNFGIIDKMERAKVTKKLIRNVENLLIFCNDNDHFKNIKGTSDIKLIEQFHVRNIGASKPLFKNCYWAAMVK